ncbi:PilZ domain-containing protein [Dyella choica]|nr:PilZ domain-containing protein [Dyella choica]
MQTEERWQAFSERVTYEGPVHLAIEPFEPTPEDVARLNERNLHVLRSLASLDEHKADIANDGDTPLMQELQRMDSKLNVLLDIVDRLLLPVALLPPRQVVSFNVIGLIVPNQLVPPDSGLRVRLHFDACRALPLELLVERGKAVGDDNVFLFFRELSEMVEDGLERFVFCHHRRKVASARLTGTAETVLGSKHRM